MQAIVGQTLLQGPNTVNTKDVLESCKFVAIYFGAHWAPPCRLFTQTLRGFYESTNQGHKQIEVIFVSLDGNKEAFLRNFNGTNKNEEAMPWLAVPYEAEDRIQTLKMSYGINGIPTLVVLDPQGKLITYDGRKDIQQKP